MNPPTKSTGMLLARHLDPPIRMLQAAIHACPDNLWESPDTGGAVWQHCLHATRSLQKWMRVPHQPFDPPSFAADEAVFETPASPAVSREAVAAYLSQVGDNALALLQHADDDQLRAVVEINEGVHTLADQALGQTRHLMYHVGAISTIIKQATGQDVPWNGATRE